MIEHYFRPSTLQEAISLLKGIGRIPLAGGTFITSILSKDRETYELVDLQDLQLDNITITKEIITIGATTTLQALIEHQFFSDPFKKSIILEAPLNLRNSISMGGLLRTCSGKSPFATCLLSLDAKIILEPHSKIIPIQDFLLFREKHFPGSLITKIQFLTDQQVSFHSIARTKYDIPILFISLTRKGSNRFRQSLGGFGITPLLTVDGNDKDDYPQAARSACANVSDPLASAEYRSAMAEVLSKRCLNSMVPLILYPIE